MLSFLSSTTEDYSFGASGKLTQLVGLIVVHMLDVYEYM